MGEIIRLSREVASGIMAGFLSLLVGVSAVVYAERG